MVLCFYFVGQSDGSGILWEGHLGQPAKIVKFWLFSIGLEAKSRYTKAKLQRQLFLQNYQYIVLVW